MKLKQTKTMWPGINDWFFNNSPEKQEAIDEGFEMAESYFQEAVREFYRDLRKGLLKRKATTSTTSTHKCNCEFCWTNRPKEV